MDWFLYGRNLRHESINQVLSTRKFRKVPEKVARQQGRLKFSRESWLIIVINGLMTVINLFTVLPFKNVVMEQI